MSVNFGQARKETFGGENSSNYIESVTFTVNNINTVGNSTIDKTFIDQCITANLVSDTNYYLKFSIQAMKDPLDINRNKKIDIILSADNDTVETQNIDTIIIPSWTPITEDEIAPTLNFEYIITPKNSYSKINFIIRRDIDDYMNTNINNDRYVGLSSENISFNKVKDLISEGLVNATSIKQLGIQAPSGFLMCIDGEQIRVGKTRRYEINYGITINKLGFIPNKKKIDTQGNISYVMSDFILDYQY